MSSTTVNTIIAIIKKVMILCYHYCGIVMKGIQECWFRWAS